MGAEIELNERNGFKLTDQQIESILDKLVPLIANLEDREFFRAILRIKAEESYSCQFAAFVERLLKSVA